MASYDKEWAVFAPDVWMLHMFRRYFPHLLRHPNLNNENELAKIAWQIKLMSPKDKIDFEKMFRFNHIRDIAPSKNHELRVWAHFDVAAPYRYEGGLWNNPLLNVHLNTIES